MEGLEPRSDFYCCLWRLAAVCLVPLSPGHKVMGNPTFLILVMSAQWRKTTSSKSLNIFFFFLDQCNYVYTIPGWYPWKLDIADADPATTLISTIPQALDQVWPLNTGTIQREVIIFWINLKCSLIGRGEVTTLPLLPVHHYYRQLPGILPSGSPATLWTQEGRQLGTDTRVWF